MKVNTLDRQTFGDLYASKTWFLTREHKKMIKVCVGKEGPPNDIQSNYWIRTMEIQKKLRANRNVWWTRHSGFHQHSKNSIAWSCRRNARVWPNMKAAILIAGRKVNENKTTSEMAWWLEGRPAPDWCEEVEKTCSWQKRMD